MNKNYEDKIQKLQLFQIFLVSGLLFALAVYVFIVSRPEITAYVVTDSCGPIGGTVSHSIDDPDACANACSAQCLSFEKAYKDSKYESTGVGCNTCDCFCKG